MPKYFSFFILTLLLPSCISPYEPTIPASDTRVLVVEGQITDEPGPFRVKLTNSFDLDNLQLYGEPELGAQVEIFDDKGNLFQLYYTSNGWYETEDTLLQGVPGNTYTLTITTAGGIQYESTPELMPDVPEIDSVYFEEVTKTRFEDGQAIDENWLDIFVDAHDETGQTDYWKWDFVETWEINLITDSVTVLHGFIDSPDRYYATEEIELNKNNMQKCWVTIPSKSLLISTTRNDKINQIKKFPLKSIPFKNDRLHIKYSLLIKQYALSQKFYKYLEKLKESNEESGGIYEKIPEQIFGNIECCNGDDHALGYFSASAVKVKRIFINPEEVHIKTKSAYSGCIYRTDPNPMVIRYFYGSIVPGGQRVYTYDVYCSDCREYGSEVKPDLWEE